MNLEALFDPETINAFLKSKEVQKLLETGKAAVNKFGKVIEDTNKATQKVKETTGKAKESVENVKQTVEAVKSAVGGRKKSKNMGKVDQAIGNVIGKVVPENMRDFVKQNRGAIGVGAGMLGGMTLVGLGSAALGARRKNKDITVVTNVVSPKTQTVRTVRPRRYGNELI